MKKIRLLLVILGILTAFFFYGAFCSHSSRLPSGGSLEPPSAEHCLGTDNLGVDICAQISAGFWHSMSIGILTAGLSFVLGGSLGILAGYLGGKADEAVSFVINLMLCLPRLPVMVVIGAFWGQSMWNIIGIITAFSWAAIARQMRAQTMSIRNRQYVQLARSYGGSVWYIVTRHMLKDLLPLLTVSSIGVIGTSVVQESSLAYLGLSDPLARSWGLMISRAVGFPGIFMTDFWKWWLLPPVLALTGSVLCLRLLAVELERLWLKEG